MNGLGGVASGLNPDVIVIGLGGPISGLKLGVGVLFLCCISGLGKAIGRPGIDSGLMYETGFDGRTLVPKGARSTILDAFKDVISPLTPNPMGRVSGLGMGLNGLIEGVFPVGTFPAGLAIFVGLNCCGLGGIFCVLTLFSFCIFSRGKFFKFLFTA